MDLEVYEDGSTMAYPATLEALAAAGVPDAVATAAARATDRGCRLECGRVRGVPYVEAQVSDAPLDVMQELAAVGFVVAEPCEDSGRCGKQQCPTARFGCLATWTWWWWPANWPRDSCSLPVIPATRLLAERPPR
jgi:hypothetical protein